MKENKKDPKNNTHEICFRLLVEAAEEMLHSPRLQRRETFDDHIFTKVSVLSNALEMSHFSKDFIPASIDKLRQFADMGIDRMPKSIKMRLGELISNLEAR